MKRAITILCGGLLLLGANAVSTSSDTNRPREPASCTASVDTPPPIECPMCGGNAELHRKRVRALLGLQATLMMTALATR